MTDQVQEQADILAELTGGDVDKTFGGMQAEAKVQIPAGKAQLKIENVYLNRAKSSNRKQLIAVCKITAHETEPAVIDKKYYKMWGLETEENLQWLINDVANLELKKPTSLKQLPKLINEMMGVEFEGAFVDNKDPNYPPNMFINAGARTLSVSTPSESGEADTAY